MAMTKAEAKALSLEVWGYLAEHPECLDKSKMPPALYYKVKDYIFACPLCELFRMSRCVGCVLCKLGGACGIRGSAYDTWRNARVSRAGNAIREAAAKRIYEIIQTMETEEEE
jgi:hypothetical protein